MFIAHNLILHLGNCFWGVLGRSWEFLGPLFRHLGATTTTIVLHYCYYYNVPIYTAPLKATTTHYYYYYCDTFYNIV